MCFSHCVFPANLSPLASLYAQRQNINMQRIQTLRGAVAAEEVPDFTGKCCALVLLALAACFILVGACFLAPISLF